MIKNYFLTAWRNLMKSKLFSVINVLGLTIGITVFLMIFLFVNQQFSFDRFHENKDRIYRVMRGLDSEEGKKQVAYLSGPYAPALLNDFPGQIERAVRVMPTEGLVTIGETAYREKNVFDADADFFQLFSFPLLIGEPQEVLKNPLSVVLTRSTAMKYFGSIEGAVGRVIELDKELYLTVTGIADDVPANSHLNFDLVVPIENYRESGNMTTWINHGLYTYVLLAPGTGASEMNKQMPRFMDKYMGNDMKKFGFHFSLSLQPLADVYFQNDAFDQVKHGDKSVVYVFLSIAVLILLIACINFANLSTIRAVERAREVGMRKVLGAVRKQLIGQFMGESVFLALLACLLAPLFMFTLMPWYERLLDEQIAVSQNLPALILFLIPVCVLVGFLGGIYPAFFLSGFSPVSALKGRIRIGKGGTLFRQGLVVVQFTISVFLILGTLVIFRQMHYVQTRQLGYQDEQVVVIPIDNADVYRNRLLFKQELEGNRDIFSVSMMSGEPGGFFDTHIFEVEGRDEKWQSRTEFADFEFVKTLGLKVIAGRDLSGEFPTDTTEAVLINRTAAGMLGWTPDRAVGKWIKNTVRDEARRRIVGVIEDFNFLSLKEKMDALVISPSNDRRVILVKTRPGNVQQALALIEGVYRKAAPGYPFEYSFLDAKFEELYRKDLRTQTVFTLFAGLAIFVACLGLLGLASFTVAKRYKEIGVRKVLGSSVGSILMLLSAGLLRPVMIGICISLPLGYLVMNRWLQSFAYKTAIHWELLLLAALVTIVVSFATVCTKAIRAAMANPVKSLRSE